MRRITRAGFIAVLVVALVAAFSFSYADEFAPRRLSDRQPRRSGLRFAARGDVFYALPSTDGANDKNAGRDILKYGADVVQSEDGCRRAPATRRDRASTGCRRSSIICIYVNHPHHAPPSEV